MVNPTNGELKVLVDDLKKLVIGLQKTIEDKDVALTTLMLEMTEVKAELSSAKEELEGVKEELMSAKKELLDCKKRDNDREQYARCWSVRVFGLDVTKEEEDTHGKDAAVMRKAYNKIFKPVLTAAKSKGACESVPGWQNLLGNGHKVGKPYMKDGIMQPSACIVRFSSRYMRNVFLRHKKEHMPSPTEDEKKAGVSKFFVTEDLTKANYDMLQKLIKETSVDKVWTIDGNIRFVTVADKKITKRVRSPFDQVKDILEV